MSKLFMLKAKVWFTMGGTGWNFGVFFWNHTLFSVHQTPSSRSIRRFREGVISPSRPKGGPRGRRLARAR